MFQIICHDTASRARLGRLTTAHGVVETPAFMMVGTQGSVKTLAPRDLEEMGAQMILSNTYHLAIRPGIEIVRKVGGLHRFMAWPGPILTDSGGYQVFSLANIRKIQETGVAFQSHLDGSPLFLGPNEAMAIQQALGSDIAMAFDECPPATATWEEVERAVDRTIRWAHACRQAPRAADQLVFGIVQGGRFAKLREHCARAIVDLDFDGYAIGGVSVGEPEPFMLRAVDMSEPLLPAGKPRYAMGLGAPDQIVELVARGIDLFDCVLPTRLARNGTAFTRTGTVNIKAGYHKGDERPIEEGCGCYACRTFSRAYLRHLLKAEEILGLRMITLHNGHRYLDLMREIRGHLSEGTFEEFRREFVRAYLPSEKVRMERRRECLETREGP